MRGISEKQFVMLSLISPESRVPKDHPLRQIKAMADQELKHLWAKFDQMYSHTRDGLRFLPRRFSNRFF